MILCDDGVVLWCIIMTILNENDHLQARANSIQRVEEARVRPISNHYHLNLKILIIYLKIIIIYLKILTKNWSASRGGGSSWSISTTAEDQQEQLSQVLFHPRFLQAKFVVWNGCTFDWIIIFNTVISISISISMIILIILSTRMVSAVGGGGTSGDEGQRTFPLRKAR